MLDEASEVTKERYFSLRERLSDMNYSSSFGPDSLDLVERIFNDLVSTTEAYKQLSETERSLSNDLTIAHAQLFPLKKENSRLTRENYQLHVDGVKTQDEVAKRITDQSVHVIKLEEELRDMKFILKSKDAALATAETERNRIKEAYELLTLPSSKERAQVRPSMHLSWALNETPLPLPVSSVVCESSSDANTIDLLREKTKDLSEQLKKIENEKKALQGSVAHRDAELARFVKTSSITEGNNETSGSKLDKMIAADIANQKVIDQLNDQVDFLNEQLALREAQLADSVEKANEAVSMRLEIDMRNNQLKEIKNENQELIGQLRAFESKVQQLSRAVDPEIELEGDIDEDQENAMDDNSTDTDPIAITKGTYKRNRQKLKDIKNISTSKASTPASKVDSSISKSDTSILIDKLTSDREGLMGEIDRLSETLSSIQSGDSVLKERARRADEKIKELKTQLKKSSEDSDRLNRLILDRDAVISSLTDKANQLENNLKVLMEKEKDITDRELEFMSQSSTVEQQLSVVVRERDHFENLVVDMKKEIAGLKREKFDYSAGKDITSGRLSQLEQENSALKEKLSTVNSDLLDAKTNLTKYELSIESLSANLESERKRNNLLSSKYSEINESIKKKDADLSDAVSMIGELKVKLGLGSSASIQSSDAYLKNELRICKETVDNLESEKSALVIKVDDLERSISALRSQLQIANVNLQGEEEENKKLITEVRSKDEEFSRLRKELKSKEIEFEKSNIKFQELVDKYHVVSSSQKSIVEQYDGQNQLVEELEGEIRLLKLRLQEYTHAYNNEKDLKDGQSESINRATERLSKAERDLSVQMDQNTSLRRELSRAEADNSILKTQIESMNRKNAGDRADLRRAIEEKDVAEQKVAELRDLVANIEITARNNGYKCQRLEAALAEADAEKKALMTDKQKIIDDVDGREQTIRNLNETLQNLDKERDYLQAQLDVEAEYKVSMEQKMKHYESQTGQYRDMVDKAEKRSQYASQELNTASRQISILEARLNSAKDEVIELKRHLQGKSQEIGGASEDLMLMTKENQALTSELAEASHERDRMRARIVEFGEVVAGLEHSKRAVEIEKEDILQSYRTVIQEKTKLESDLHAMGELREKTGAESQLLSSQLSELKGQLGSRVSVDNRVMAEKISLQRQVESSNEQLVLLQRRQDAVEADNRRLMQDVYGLRQTNQMLNERVSSIIKRASSAGDANKVLSARLMNAERERDATRALLETERQRTKDLETLTETARVDAITKEIQSSKSKDRWDVHNAKSTVTDTDSATAQGRETDDANSTST